MSFKKIIDSAIKFSENNMFKNLPKDNPPLERIIIENPVHKTNKTIEELKEIIIEQGITADKQANTIVRMTILALVFAFISIVPVLREYIHKITPKNNDRDIYELKSKVLFLSNTNLENQVRILKVENEMLKEKKASKNEKKTP